MVVAALIAFEGAFWEGQLGDFASRYSRSEFNLLDVKHAEEIHQLEMSRKQTINQFEAIFSTRMA